MSSNLPIRPPQCHSLSISKTVSATKNLRSISKSLVRKLRTHSGLSSTQLATELAQEALRDVVGNATPLPPNELTAIEKNIRRRLYDSLKVLISIGAIARSPKDKSLTWLGVRHLLPQLFQSPASSSSPIPSQSLSCPSLDRSTLFGSITHHRTRLAAKTLQLSQLRAQARALMALCNRNHSKSSPEPTRIHMPFVLIRTPISTEITLDATPDCTRIAFEFQGYYELVNDSSILDRLFLVERSTLPNSLPYVQSPTATHVMTGKKRDAVFAHEAEAVDPYSSPKRQKVASISPFAKYTTGQKPPLSPALARRMCHSSGSSPLQASLRALAGHSVLSEDVNDNHHLLSSPVKTPTMTPPRKRRLDFNESFLYGRNGQRPVNGRRMGYGHRLYAQQTQRLEERAVQGLGMLIDDNNGAIKSPSIRNPSNNGLIDGG